jgi:hypothetical protein
LACPAIGLAEVGTSLIMLPQGNYLTFDTG